MTHGAGPSGHYDLQQLGNYSRAELRTSVQLRLPFGVPGVIGTFDVTMPTREWRATFAADYLTLPVIFGQLEGALPTFDENGCLIEIRAGNSVSGGPPTSVVALNPDRWGRSWRTLLTLDTDSFLDPEFDPDRTGPADMARRVLPPCCECVNRVLDVLAYVGGASDLPHVVPADFWSIHVTYSGPSGYVGSFSAIKLQTVWWGARAAHMGESKEDFTAILQNPEGLPISDELLVTSHRKAAGGDFRGAIIDAVCSVEAAVGQYLDTYLDERGISNRRRKEFLGPTGVSLAMRVTVLLPVLVELGVPAEILDAFAAANAKRNGIVHRGERANAAEAERSQAAATMLIDCLRGYSRVIPHWDGQSFKRERPSI